MAVKAPTKQSPVKRAPRITSVEARERVAQARKIAGDGAEVGSITLELHKLAENGVFVAIEASGFSSLDRRITWRALGIEMPPGMTTTIRPPTGGFLPERHRKALRRPLSQAYDLVKRYSHQVSAAKALFGLTSYGWMTWKAFVTFEDYLAVEMERLAQAKADILDHYDQIKVEMAEDFTRMAKDSAKRAAAMGLEVDENFVANVVEGLMAMVPSRDFISSELTIVRRVNISMTGYEAERERQRIYQSEAEAEAWTRIQAAKEEEAMRQIPDLISPVKEMQVQLRAAVHQSASEMAKAIRENGFMHPRTAKHARELAAWFRDMDLADDSAVQSMLSRLETYAADPVTTNKEALGDTQTLLDSIIEETYKSARAAGKADRIRKLEF